VHERCTLEKTGEDVQACCARCPDFAPAVPQPKTITRVGGLTEPAFNGSLIRFKGELYLAYRNSLCGSSIFVVHVGGHLQPLGENQRLDLRHPLCHAGCEDPRLFVFRDRLHCSFNGVQMIGPRTIVNVLVARLRDDMTVEHVWEPKYEQRAAWEKSWGFFEHDGELLCVYQPAPRHLILRHDNEIVEPWAESSWQPQWTGGDMRGGAPPVRVGNEYWSFVHGTKYNPSGWFEYVVGLYTFEASWPFRPCRIAPVLLNTDQPGTINANRAVYPCGAVKDDDRWLISYGLSDTFVEVAEFDHGELEKCLVKI
jgi:predicted GH43/DUF377 family glycosyl hydrolase